MSYQTEQKKQLIKFLSDNSDSYFTIDEIASLLTGEKKPGKSTIYRLIGNLVDEGVVKRFTKGNTRHFLYQFTGNEDCHYHLHLKCLECGKLVHLTDELTDKAASLIGEAAGFSVNNEQSLLYGTCRDCKNNETCKTRERSHLE